LVIVDLREVSQVGDTVYDVDGSFGLTTANGCNDGIDAIISTFWTFDLICGDLISNFRWDSGTADPQLVSEKWPDIEWSTGLNVHIGAAVREPVTGQIRLWKGNQIVDIYPEGTAIVSPGKYFGAKDEDVCNVDNCATCSQDRTSCVTCKSGYSSKRQGRVCRTSNYIVDISFEDSDYTSSFYQYALGGEWAAADNGGWDIDGTIVSGAFEDGIQLDGQTEIRLQPVTFDGEENIQDWKVSFWWWPDRLSTVKLLTLNRQTTYEDSSLTYTESFVIWLVVNSTTEPIDAGKFAIELDMYGKFLDCYVDHPIRLRFWNKISIEFREGEIITSANGQWHEIAMDGVKETDDISVSFQDWTLGDSERGISGILDAFEVYRPSSGASPSKAVPVYVWAIVGFVVLSVIFVIYCFIYPRYCKSTKSEKASNAIEIYSAPKVSEPTIAPSGGQTAIKRAPMNTPPKPFNPPRPAMTPPKPSGVPPLPGAVPPKPIGLPPSKPNFAPPRPTGRTSGGRRAPPRPKNLPTSGSRNSGGGLNLALSPQERRESWKV